MYLNVCTSGAGEGWFVPPSRGREEGLLSLLFVLGEWDDCQGRVR
jgi:hypothetical protein